MGKIVLDKFVDFYHYYPKVVAMVSTAHGGREDFMPAAWHCPISFDPPLYGVSVSPKRFTFGLIMEAKEFAIGFMPFEKADLIAKAGGLSGKDVDKFKETGARKDKPLKIRSPILADAYASYECKLYSHHTCGDHEWFVGEIVAVHYDEKAFAENGVMKLEYANPALYIGSDKYMAAKAVETRHFDRRLLGQKKA
ncbi:MAG: flavin reductase family protein [Candidatus Eisenbacteria bacterium]|nr:flavin reductase family protein [Candidatus Eisenbacteria bacterium]